MAGWPGLELTRALPRGLGPAALMPLFRALNRRWTPVDIKLRGRGADPWCEGNGAGHGWCRCEAGRRYGALLEPGAIRAVFQPIVRLTDLAPIGYEGLSRFPAARADRTAADVTLAAAGRAGMRQELEVACWAAIAEAGAPPDGRLLFVNVAPD